METSLNIGFADSIKIVEDLGRCELESQSFRAFIKDSSIAFTLIGTDASKTLDTDRCLARLSTLAMTGFTVEFKNVPTMSSLNRRFVDKVTLRVEIK